ncbi:hypothetical protein C1645_738900 [Glomus cerebriforme]|uniref:ATPase AAA-type core domain-containing protein n=1 Tax=Glomus cerebriforme TaxID=658196 RepID=A0A397SSF1_9GLOM|nr:hypothetical protein C1645_738900 [Glomus cerebriforme]
MYCWYQNICNERLLNETIEKGTWPKISEDNLVPRPVIVEHLKRILWPSKDQSFYHVVCGEHGTGKTTLTWIASREVGQVKDKNNKVIQDGGMDKLTYPKWIRAMDAFKRGAEVYRKKHGKPPVIIYDNISQLIHKNPEILDILQDDAKNNADERNYIAVFISNEGRLPGRMEYKPVMEIGDFSEKESKDYLIKRCTIEKREGNKITKECKIKDEQVNELYELVGGCIIDLKFAVNEFLAGQSFEDIKR